MPLHEPFIRTFSLGPQGISRFSQAVSVFANLKLLVPRNRNSKKIARPRGPLHQALAPSRTVIRCNSVPRWNAEVPIDVRITLFICQDSFSICISLSLIPAYVYLSMYTHFPPLPYSYTFIAIFICLFCVLFYIFNHLLVFFLPFLQI